MNLRPHTLVIVAVAALALAACGSDDDGSGGAADAGGGGASVTAPVGEDASAPTVSVDDIDGLGTVLVDSTGMPLYFADEEADGQVRCTDACTSFWLPLEPATDAPTAADGVPDLSVIERPDGSRQVAAEGKLLYTFSEDSPGNATGDGFEDDFGDQHLTWHAMRVDGTGTTDNGSTPGGTISGVPNYDY